MPLAAWFIAINPWVTPTGLPLQYQEEMAYLKLQPWPGVWARTAVTTSGACSACPAAKPHIQTQECTRGRSGCWSPQLEVSSIPKGRCPSQSRRAPWGGLLVHPEGLLAALHPLEPFGGLFGRTMRKTPAPDRNPSTPCYEHFGGCPEFLLLSPTCLCQVLQLRGGAWMWGHI